MNNQHSLSIPTMAKHQTGVVLIISLIMLLALTLIGVTSSSVTSLEEKMAANSKDINLAFQAAEAALRDAETNRLKSEPAFNLTAADTAQGTNGLYSLLSACATTATAPAPPRDDTTTPSLRPFYNTVDWYGTKVVNYTNTSGSATKLVGLSRPPAYIIEEIGCTPAESDGGGGGSLCASGGPCVPVAVTGKTIMMRITAHGWGSNANSVATVQSVVKVTY